MDDESIVNLYFARDPDAIAHSQERYGGLCFATAKNILASEEDAQECVNDTWLRAWNAIPPTRPKRLGVFLARITRNLSLERWRANHAQKRGGGIGAMPIDELAECIPGGEDPAAAVQLQVLEDSLARFLKTLKQTERVVFLARYWYGAPIREIALRLGLSEGRVKTMLFRARNKLRAHLEKEGLQ